MQASLELTAVQATLEDLDYVTDSSLKLALEAEGKVLDREFIRASSKQCLEKDIGNYFLIAIYQTAPVG